MSASSQGGGCGSGSCGCSTAAAPRTVPAINGIALHTHEEAPSDQALRELAWAELLRQAAVRRGMLPDHPGQVAPALSAGDQAIVEGLLDAEVPLRHPGEDECRRYFEANRQRFVRGRQAHVRHVLFAVTEGVDVNKLAARAEQALLELLRKDAAAERFPALARELSNCPSGAAGGDLGWIAPEDCAEELRLELFDAREPRLGLGVHARLLHSRYGFHIVEVLGRKLGEPLAFAQVHQRIAAELGQRSRATALHQFVRVLAGQARVEGVDLEGAESPLVQ